MSAQKIRLALLLAVLVAGCDSTSLQDEFARAAGRTPEGYTATDRDGQVSSEDPDDWRTAPFFAGKVRVEPPFPNPTTGQSVTLTVTLLEFGAAPGGVSLQARRSNGTFATLDVLREDAPGTYLLTFSPALVARAGLVRLFLFDSAGEIISYGDVLIN